MITERSGCALSAITLTALFVIVLIFCASWIIAEAKDYGEKKELKEYHAERSQCLVDERQRKLKFPLSEDIDCG